MRRYAVKVDDKYVGENGSLVVSFASAKRFDRLLDALRSIPLVYLDRARIACGECGETECERLLP